MVRVLLVINRRFLSNSTVHRLAHDVSRTVRSYSKNVHVGQSLKHMLVSSSFASPECPREVYRRKAKRRGRPVKGRTCEISMSDGQCMSQNVVYSIFVPFVERSIWERRNDLSGSESRNI